MLGKEVSAGAEMSFNITALGFDEDLFFAVVFTVLFAVLVLPAVVLNAVCVVALLLAKAITWQIRVIIINIFVADIFYSFALSLIDLGYPIRVALKDNEGSGFSCNMTFAFLTLSFQSNLLALSLYAVAVYTYIKHGIKKLKWYFTVAWIAVSWGLCSLLGLLIAAKVFDIRADSSNGFCEYQISEDLVFTRVFAVSNALEMVLCVSFVSIFGILTYRYIKNNILEENVAIKRAMAKILLYQAVKVFFLILRVVFGVGFNNAFNAFFQNRTGVIIMLVADFILVKLLLGLSLFLTPVASLFFLQPLRNALKCCLCCCRTQAAVPEPPTARSAAIEMQQSQRAGQL